MVESILLAHGGGGGAAFEFLHQKILPHFQNPYLDVCDDAAVLPLPVKEGQEPFGPLFSAPPFAYPPRGYDSKATSSAEIPFLIPSVAEGRLAFTTDSYVVHPLIFPGGTIGDLAVCGTVNDLAMQGARPLWVSLALILEEGFSVEKLDLILEAVARRAKEAGVTIVCGDTKVVGHGQADGLYITTAGIGWIPPGVDTSANRARPGDAVILSGVPGLHGLTVLLARGGLRLSSPIESDVGILYPAVAAMIKKNPEAVHGLRDLTRGGLAAALDDIARASEVTIEIDEALLPRDPAQEGACEILGIQSIHAACEGRFVAIVDASWAEEAVAILRAHPIAREATRIGWIKERGRFRVELRTSLGTRRAVMLPRGEEMPRIC